MSGLASLAERTTVVRVALVATALEVMASPGWRQPWWSGSSLFPAVSIAFTLVVAALVATWGRPPPHSEIGGAASTDRAASLLRQRFSRPEGGGRSRRWIVSTRAVQADDGWQTRRFRAPASAWRIGANELILDFPPVRSPKELGLSDDRRHLVMAVQRIDVEAR